MPVTSPKAKLSLPIEATGSLQVETTGGHKVNLVAAGSRLRADLTDRSALNDVAPRSWNARRKAIARAARVLSVLNLRVDIDVSSEHAIGMGANTRPSLLARILGLGPVHMPIASVAALLRHS